MTSVWAGVIAVAGTLLGAVVAGVVQARQARVARRALVRDQRRTEMVAAVTALAVALAEHRRATWVAAGRRLSGVGEQVVAEATGTTHDTWAAVTAALVTVKVLAPAFAAAADEVTEAIYAMGEAPDQTALESRRTAARAAHDRLLAAASEFFTGEGCRGGGR